MSIENTGQYHGLYHVLGGIISPINGIGPSDLTIRELVARVKAVLRRAGLFSENSAVQYNDGLSIDFNSRTVKKNDVEITLTPNEYKLLKFLAQNAGRYFSREDLIEGAIGAKYDGYDRAVDSHIKNLRQKIEDNPKTPKYIVTQYGVGYKFAGTKA